MPDYTDPYLIPFPTAEEFGDGALGLEEMARVVDTLHEEQVARLTSLSTRPTVIRRRSTDQAASGFHTITWDATDHNNFTATNFATPVEGGHPVAGVYPALWRFDVWVSFIASAPVTGDDYRLSISLSQALPGETFSQTTRQWSVNARENGTGGEYLKANGAVLLATPGEFTNRLEVPAGNVKAGSWMSLTRIRSV